jgi:hypothetical protein
MNDEWDYTVASSLATPKVLKSQLAQQGASEGLKHVRYDVFDNRWNNLEFNLLQKVHQHLDTINNNQKHIELESLN